MTETVVHQNPAVVTVASPIHATWKVDAQSVVSETLSTSLVSHLVIFLLVYIID